MSPVGSRRDRIAGMALAVALHLAGLLLLGGARSADTPARLAQPASTRVTIHMPAARPTIAPPAPAAAPAAIPPPTRTPSCLRVSGLNRSSPQRPSSSGKSLAAASLARKP